MFSKPDRKHKMGNLQELSGIDGAFLISSSGGQMFSWDSLHLLWDKIENKKGEEGGQKLIK